MVTVTAHPRARLGRTIAAVVVTMVAAVLGVRASAAHAAVTLSADRLVFDSSRTGNWEIFSMGVDGSAPTQLTSDPRYDSWWPRVSPDRSQVLFYRTPAGTHDTDFTKTSLWVMAADGSSQRELLPAGAHGWAMQGHAMWSPDGTRLVMFAGPRDNPNIWVTNADGSSPRQVTARPGTNVDPSWDPSGTSILFVGCPLAACASPSYEVYWVNADGTGTQRLTNDLARDQDPVSSPDGRQVAWLRQSVATWGIYLMNADGTAQHGVVSDLQINSKPAWSDDGSWIFFHRQRIGQTSYGIWRVHPDGTGLEEIDGHQAIGPSPYGNEYPDQGLY